jgi:rare lipoprotein A (peptidoglycan hydrolase)
MPPFFKIKMFLFSAISLTVIYFIYKSLAQNTLNQQLKFNNKQITLNEDGLFFDTSTSAQTVDEFLREKKINLRDIDQIVPEKGTVIFPGYNIRIRRAVEIKIKVDGQVINTQTLEKNVLGALRDSGVKLGRLDKTKPEIYSVLQNNSMITVTRINIEEKTVLEEIDFKIIEKNDNKLGWREKKVEQKGQRGQREITYQITYKDGKEVSRVTLKKQTILEPVSEIIVQGTYVKTGKSHTGLGTWYAFKGGLFAASPWLPMGSYARVTNKANGKTVIVQINDRGPFGEGRIIDLDKVAFQKIASLGAGVINVKVEEIIN